MKIGEGHSRSVQVRCIEIYIILNFDLIIILKFKLTSNDKIKIKV
jgi:hypothetical protein